jgi:Sulfotransferase family
MPTDFRLIMIGAMYENGGNTTHRLLDGHPQMFVYPFESQLGTRLVDDKLTATFPVKYRWPVFDLDATPTQDYQRIIDEECKVRARTPHVSKFRDFPFDMPDDDRRDRYVTLVEQWGRTRASNVAAFFTATFDAWKDRAASGREEVYVGYSPIITVDASRILDEIPGSHFVHVVRNPWSAYVDTKKRPVPLSLEDYLLGWTLTQHCALLTSHLYPDRMHVLRIEDVMADPEGTLGGLCDGLGLERSPSLLKPSWNGRELTEVYPWGTIRRPTPDENRAAAAQLSDAEAEQVRARAWQYLDVFEYADFR